MLTDLCGCLVPVEITQRGLLPVRHWDGCGPHTELNALTHYDSLLHLFLLRSDSDVMKAWQPVRYIVLFKNMLS